MPLPSRHEQVEQDRAPDVLPHHRELAGPPAGEPGGGGEPDRAHDDEDRLGDPVGIGRGELPDGSGSQRRADGRLIDQARQVPRRVELHDSPKTVKWTVYCGETPYYRGSRRDCDSQPMLMRRELRSGALITEKRVELTIKWGRALAVAAARFHAKGTFEVRCANRSCRVRERVGVSDRSAQRVQSVIEMSAGLEKVGLLSSGRTCNIE